MNRVELLFPALLFVAVATLLCAGLLVLDYSWAIIAFPFGAGLVLCVLCLLQLATFIRRRESIPDRDDRPVEPLAASTFAWVVALPVSVYGLGFVAGPAVYLLAHLKMRGFSWRFASAIAVGSLVVTWGLFIKLLHILLPMEPLWLS